LRCENVKINRMIVIFTELFKVHLTIYRVEWWKIYNGQICLCRFVNYILMLIFQLSW